MKKFLGKAALYFVLLLAPFAAFFGYVQALPAAAQKSLMGGVMHKQMLLQNTPSPKIVVVGGSSAPYAVISQKVQDAFGMPCINLGATAYLGIEFYLAQMKGCIGQGDIIILAPEYSMYQNAIDYSTVWMAVENHWPVMKKLPLRYYPPMAAAYADYAGYKLRQKKSTPQNESYEAQYAAAGYGPWGDITTERDNILEKKYNTEDLWTVDASVADEWVIRQLNRFARYAKAQGAEVYLTFAPFNRLALQNGLAGVQALENRLLQECQIPWLGSLTQGVLSENLFYDSNNHLNSRGAELRTEMLLDALAKAQEKSLS